MSQVLHYLQSTLGLEGADLLKVIKMFPEALACRYVANQLHRGQLTFDVTMVEGRPEKLRAVLAMRLGAGCNFVPKSAWLGSFAAVCAAALSLLILFLSAAALTFAVLRTGCFPTWHALRVSGS